MTISGISYLRLFAVLAVLAMTLVGLNGRLSRTTSAREKSTTTPGEIALTPAQKFSKRSATLVVAEGATTTTTVPEPLVNLGGV